MEDFKMCKKSKPTKSTEQYKILRMISRDEQFERYGGGQFVSMNRAYKDKSKYNRNDKKKELRSDLNSFLFILFCQKHLLHQRLKDWLSSHQSCFQTKAIPVL